MEQKDLALRLQAILDGDYDPDVKEAAQEALDKINSKVSK
jgi:hypothetical protein